MLLERALALLPEAPAQARAFIETLPREARGHLRLQAQRHGFETLLAATGAAGFEVEPARARVERFQFTRHRQATLALAQHLTAAGVDVLLVKGAPLAERLYATRPVEPWMRPPGDIDLFVSPSALDLAAEVLRDAGLQLIDDPRVRHASAKHSVDFRGREGRLAGIFVELHAHLSHSPWRENLEFAALFERGRPWPVAAEASPRQKVLDPVDELIFLASHGAGHRFEQLKWLFDLKLCARQLSDAGTEEIWQRAEICRARQALGLGLWALASRLDLDLGDLRHGARRTTALRRALYSTALAMGPSLSAPRGLITCLLLADQLRPSMARPLAALGLEKLRRARAAPQGTAAP